MAETQYPLVQELALAHAGANVRPLLSAFFDLDLRLAHFVSQAKEPILTQMRIAWWRDQLLKSPEDRPQGDPILDALTASWRGEELALIALVNGWEGMLAEPPLPDDAALEFVSGRGACFAALARLSGCSAVVDAAQSAGETWAWADLTSRLSDTEEREHIVGLASSITLKLGRLPYKLRCMRILASLGAKSINSSGASLISGRKDLLHIARLGLFGR